ncbi:hypothetical protein ES703_111274 [subsurface metagenome]
MTHHDENLCTIYEQYWLHARHQENQRLWYTNVYAILVSGLVVFMSYKEEWYLPALVVGFSILGFFLCHSVRIPFLRYSRYTDVILWNEWNIGDKYARFIRKPPGKKRSRTFKIAMVKAFGFLRFRGMSELKDKVTNVSLMFHTFYIIMATVFTAWTAYLLWGCSWKLVVVPTLVFIVMWVVYNFWFGLLEEQVRDEMARKVDWDKIQRSS